MIVNPELDLAFEFASNTNRNIFLTGKAGTGKTTFLHSIREKIKKRMVVLAPTGVAAINAKGVTIHSFFQLPFGPIAPDSNQEERLDNKFNKNKINIIKSLDLLVIDEISMVRADLLDAIDYILRRFKDRNKVFGGVQLLMIGDLQQLSPVVRPDEWDILKQYYGNAYFFSSLAYQQAAVIPIELKHIYRQKEAQFISILNEIRNDILSEKSAKILNDRYQPDFKPEADKKYITLTTHNQKAQSINQKAMQELQSESQIYTATINGNFVENTYPTDEHLQLKVGAQVMFIKNDSSPEKQYFNGKIGTVNELTEEEVWVQCGDELILAKEETWENIRYKIDSKTHEISEEKRGDFTQIPLRTAWAITIHKSQGLSFDYAIIDAQEAFAHGQTYVALSRCRSLGGLVLKTPIGQRAIISDREVKSFNEASEQQQADVETLKQSKRDYQLELMADLFNFNALFYLNKRLISIYYRNKTALNEGLVEPLQNIKDKILEPFLKISEPFKKQLQNLSQEQLEVLPEQNTAVQERFKKAVGYFLTQIESGLEPELERVRPETDNQTVKKDIEKILKELGKLLDEKRLCLEALKSGFDTLTYLKTRAEAKLKPSKKKKRMVEVQETQHPVLFEDLRYLRMRLSEEEDVPPYQIFTQKSLFALCELLPGSKSLLSKVHGLGKKRIEKYGAKILECIQNYCNSEGIEPTTESLKMSLEPASKGGAKQTAKGTKINTKQQSLELMEQGLSLKEIAEKRGLVEATIYNHIAHFVLKGELPLQSLMSSERMKEIEEMITDIDFDSLGELKEAVGEAYSYPELRLVLELMKQRMSKNE